MFGAEPDMQPTLGECCHNGPGSGSRACRFCGSELPCLGCLGVLTQLPAYVKLLVTSST